MAFLLRYRISVAVVLVAVCALGGVFLFARPEYRPPQQGESIKIPAKQPAADAAGAAGWKWPDGVPGWEPGQMIGDYPVSWIQPIEAQPAELSAAYSGLDAQKLRVVDAMHLRPAEGPFAIFAAPDAYATPPSASLGVEFPGSTSVRWFRPYDLRHSPVLVAARLRPWPGTTHVILDLVGVARGDVRRVVLHFPGASKLADGELYRRGTTWGQFSTTMDVPDASGTPVLLIYGDHGLLRRLPLDLRPGEHRIWP